MKTSGILTWNQESIKETPASKGIFVLRTSPINGFIQTIEIAENLRDALNSIYNNQLYPDVGFFEWYQIDDPEELQKKFDELKLKYSLELKHNE